MGKRQRAKGRAELMVRRYQSSSPLPLPVRGTHLALAWRTVSPPHPQSRAQSLTFSKMR